MALTACKDCKAEISTEAKNCPQCGAPNAAAYTAVRISGLIYLGLVGLLFYWIWGVLTPEPKTLRVSEAELGAAWPFTVSEVELLCEGPPPAALAKVDDKVYALNGSARGVAQEKGWLDGQAITKANPENPALKMDYSELTTRAQGLCR